MWRAWLVNSNSGLRLKARLRRRSVYSDADATQLNWVNSTDLLRADWLYAAIGSVALPIVGDSWVASVRVSIATQLNSTRRRRVELSCVAINGPWSCSSLVSVFDLSERLTQKVKWSIIQQLALHAAAAACNSQCSYYWNHHCCNKSQALRHLSVKYKLSVNFSVSADIFVDSFLLFYVVIYYFI